MSVVLSLEVELTHLLETNLRGSGVPKKDERARILAAVSQPARRVYQKGRCRGYANAAPQRSEILKTAGSFGGGQPEWTRASGTYRGETAWIPAQRRALDVCLNPRNKH
jgi:hypothetical protein